MVVESWVYTWKIANPEFCKMWNVCAFSEHYESHLNGSIWISGMQNETTIMMALLLRLKLSFFSYLITRFSMHLALFVQIGMLLRIHLTEIATQKKGAKKIFFFCNVIFITDGNPFQLTKWFGMKSLSRSNKYCMNKWINDVVTTDETSVEIERHILWEK